MKHIHPSSKSGFTLVEILLAMMVFAIAISTILALLARAMETADEILLKNEAIDLGSALESYLTEQPFEDVYGIVADSSKGFVYAFQYAGELDPNDTSDTLAPHSIEADSKVGQDYTITPAIREPDAGQLAAEEAVRQGRLYRVELTVSEANPFGTTLPSNPNADSDSDGMPDYESAVLVIQAEFYPIPVIGFDPPEEVEPVFSFNLAVRR